MLELSDLQKRYGKVVALDGISFQVRPGRVVGFLGPNGAGKTTAMRCIFGLVRPDAGEVRWNGSPVGPREHLRFGYMPEERGLYSKMKIREQLVYFGRLSGMDPSAASSSADRWLSRLGLTDRALSKLEDLSHGNQQRVQLAVSLVHGPELAVLDEPFAGLDPIGVEDMAATLRELADGGAGIVFSSHQLDLVQDVCQDVVIIDNGRVVLSGPLADLRDRSDYRHLEVAVDGKPWAPEELPGIEAVGDDGQRYLIRTGADVEEVLHRAKQDGMVTSFSFEPPNLSDLFRQAVKR
jgi:ABC-2 type transport system ATP-binding protein